MNGPKAVVELWPAEWHSEPVCFWCLEEKADQKAVVVFFDHAPRLDRDGDRLDVTVVICVDCLVGAAERARLGVPDSGGGQ